MRNLLLFVLLLLTLACQKREPVRTTEAVSNSSSESEYTLEIIFHGLMGFAHEPGKGVWAFLIDTKYDPDDPEEHDLPLGVLKEAEAEDDPAGFLEKNYPRHYPEIRITGAEVQGCIGPEASMNICEIEGADITFDTGGEGLNDEDVNLDKISFSGHALSVRTDLSEDQAANVKKLDQLDDSLTGSLGEAGLDPRLAARVLISAGQVEARPWTGCGDRTFTYNTPDDGLEGCAYPDRVTQLAEEVVAKQEVETGKKIIIRLGGLTDRDITLTPTGDIVTVEVVNQTKHDMTKKGESEALREGVEDCGDGSFHAGGFRWLYRLAKISTDVDSHLFPCLVESDAGGDKCPFKRFTIGGE